jgi:hypothetical protein
VSMLSDMSRSASASANNLCASSIKLVTALSQ